MPARRRPRPDFAALALTLAFAACATAPPPLPPGAPLAAVLAARGDVVTAAGGDPREVVVVRDRHYVGDGITYVDDDLRAVQRAHRGLVADLVARGFALMGAEWRRGPLPDDDVAAAHRARTVEILADGDDLDRWSVYQPIRYEVEFGARLAVIGVEDPDLYDADVAALERLLDLGRLARRTDTSTGPSLADLAGERVRIRRAMRARIESRGRAAALNLLEEMAARGATRAVLLVGGAHVPAAAAALRERDVPHHVFTAPAFGKRTAPIPLDER